MPVHSPSRPRALVLCCLTMAAATLVAACATLTSAPASAPQRTPDPVSTAIPRDDVTLTIVTSENAGATRALAEAFHARHPNVTVDLRYTPPRTTTRTSTANCPPTTPPTSPSSTNSARPSRTD